MNFKIKIGIVFILAFFMAMPTGFSSFQVSNASFTPLTAGEQVANSVKDYSQTMPDYLGAVDHLFNSRELTKTSSGLLHGFSANPPTTGSIEIIISLDGNSLLAEQSQRTDNGLAQMNSAQQISYVSTLKAEQSSYVTSLKSMGGTVLYTYQEVFNGIAVRIDAKNLNTIETMSGIAGIYKSNTYTPALDTSVPYIYGGKTNAELGADGTGTTIAIIDTGIDYTHADLGGSGNPADYANNDPTVIESGTFPTTKVTGGYDLVGDDYNANCPAVEPAAGVCSSIPAPDPDPLDAAGHGTHVAGIAAGIGAGDVSQGVAPGASLVALKVFGRTGSTSYANVIKAIEMAVDPNGDGCTSDHVDVINMSLGSDYGQATDPEAIASNAAVDAGVVVVAAAGNSGDQPYITGSGLASASKSISVAAGGDPGVGFQLLTVSGSNGVDGNYRSLEAAITPLLKTTGTISGSTTFVGDACEPFSTDLTGQIALIERGSCTFALKILNAQDQGAIGVVVFNNAAGAGPIVMGGDSTGITIPAVMIGNSDGLALVNGLSETTVLTLDPSNFEPTPTVMADFSSSGPRFGDSGFKPDITAPGLDIYSAAMGTGTGAVSLQGTSMASPHIAGAAALLHQAHPDWSVQDIKSAMMNTATDQSTDGQVYPLSRQGAGVVHVDKAITSSAVTYPASFSFGFEQSANHGSRWFFQKITVRNLGTTTQVFSVSSDYFRASDNDGSMQFYNPSTVVVKPGHTSTFVFKLKVNFDKLAPSNALGEYDGLVTLTEKSSGESLRVPFMILPSARSNAMVNLYNTFGHFSSTPSLSVKNYGLAGTTVDVYQFGVSSPNENLVPNQPDNWFDIQYTGAHLLDFGTMYYLEFAVTTYGNRNTASSMETDIYVDVNRDGISDYIIFGLDYGLLTGGDINGLMVSGILDLTTGAIYLEYVIASDLNTALQTVGVDFGDINILNSMNGLPQLDVNNPAFDYYIVTYDNINGAYDVSGTATFNVVNPVDTYPNYFGLNPGERLKVDVLGSGDGSLLFLYYNNYSGFNQAQVVPTSLSHHHSHHFG